MAVRAPKAVAAQRLTYAMRNLLIAYKASLEDALRGYGLTLAQLRLLHAVAEKTEVSSAAIARECHVTPQTLQAMMTRAVREGWIVREHAERNQRVLVASLTPKGRRMLERGETFARRIEAEMWTGVGAAKLSAMAETLEGGAKRIAPERPAGRR